ncbi:hypothetical protein HMI56_000795 [Coelomomyces lativittatus]|nr:hypothetical protein HMI56_000795 [Coelomomyces lativittatus]
MNASPQDALHQLLDLVKSTKSSDGRLLSKLFTVLPSKVMYPDYYQIIKHPISLREIKVKLDKGGYPDLEALKEDLELMFNNCKKYNTPKSEEWNV